MTISSDSYNTPRSLRFRQKTNDIRFIVGGQGVLQFTHDDPSIPCTFQVRNVDDLLCMVVEFSMQGIQVLYGENPLIDPKNTKGLVSIPGASYWFSLDAQNQRIYAGIGEARKETTLYRYQLETSEKVHMESFVKIQLMNDATCPIRLLRDPISRSVPLHVRDIHHLSMIDIAKGTHMPLVNLSEISQKLYGCIGGKRFILNDRDFPDFSKAIEYSIATAGCWCYETLLAKSKEFGDSNPKETYLRITLNENNGESPGIPYVMEIWPARHYSPIHNHGGAEAVIRVLHGGIHVDLFSFLGGDSFGSADFKKGDVTWISSTLNQVHQLRNLDSKTTCITIQCYMYNSEETQHYDYFDYLDAKNKVQQFTPNSDMDYVAFKELMRKEWNARRGFLQRVRRIFHI